MFVFKMFLLSFIVSASSGIGILLSKRYSNREKEIKEMKSALNMFLTKIKFTYEPIPNLFMEISNKIGGNVGMIFSRASLRMKEETAGDAWQNALDDVEHNFNAEDISVLKSLSKLLGQTDLDGQISQIEVVNQFLTSQLENASEEKKKNEKMYRTLGIITGLTIAVILI